MELNAGTQETPLKQLCTMSKFATDQGLIMTGGSDCHQKPIVMGTVQIPDFVANQFAKN